ncbi:hypothetical protein Taro_022824 [Colocasia esculenta]|uniref:Uncharacterized protein n=1 Tax=Colocasia esculenta TaxID=4460 RepID=A0A843VCK8_COLES|nr:hypothetical protein [Colocasia esculenta]
METCDEQVRATCDGQVRETCDEQVRETCDGQVTETCDEKQNIWLEIFASDPEKLNALEGLQIQIHSWTCALPWKGN